ncbi:hypothetical protein JCM10213_007638 [Rhodosporidiobolus nylandii]
MSSAYAPFIVAPPLTCCEDAYLVFGQGKAPYTVGIIASGDANGTIIEQLPEEKKAGVVRWRTDFNEGANITFVVTDGNGAQAYSQFRVVQAGEVTTCSKTNYTHHARHTGAIIGGVLGGLALIAACFALLWWRRRQIRARRVALGLDDDGKHASTDDMALASGAAGLTRAGTFNLGNVHFTEASLDHLRAIDRPPTYGEAAEPDGTPPPPPQPVPPGRRDRARLAQERADRELAEALERDEGADVGQMAPARRDEITEA